VPCCPACNYGKGTMNVYEFLAHCKTITTYRASGEHTSPHTGARKKLIRSMHSWRKRIREGHEATIAEQEYWSLVHAPCHYCGLPKSSGIDRKDSDRGYHTDNCVPCCKTCNFMKHCDPYDSFLARTARISARFAHVPLENGPTIPLPSEKEP
jgi:hypothetical protein